MSRFRIYSETDEKSITNDPFKQQVENEPDMDFQGELFVYGQEWRSYPPPFTVHSPEVEHATDKQ